MFISPTKAIKLYKVSKPTLYSDMKSGKLSYEINDRKKRGINVAELDRLYEKRKVEEGGTIPKTVNQKPDLTETDASSVKLVEELMKTRDTLSESQKRETALLKEQVEQLMNQIEHLNKNLNKALDITALLEDKREGQGTKEAQRDAKMEMLEKQLASLEEQNRRFQAIEEERLKRRRQLKKEAEEKKKGWFGRMFG